MKFKINEKYKESAYRPNKEEYDLIKESLLQYGQREPIVVNSKHVILDGHTRFEILSERGITVKYVVKDFETKEEEELYVIQTNLHRRQYNAFQKCELTYSIYLIHKKHMNRGGDTRNRKKTGGASAIVGKAIGVNRNTVQMAVWLIENASKDYLKKLRSGSLSIVNAYHLLCLDKEKTNGKYYQNTIKQTSKLTCPFCSKHFTRKELIVENEKEEKK